MTSLDDPILRKSFSNLVGATPHAAELVVRDGVGYVASQHLHHNLHRLADVHTLILHGSDATVDDVLLANVPPTIRVYAMNCASSRAHPLPIGLRIDSHDDEMLATLRRVSCEPKGDKLAYLCATWDSPNLPECARVERQKLYERFGGESWVTAKGGRTMGDVAFAEYCADLRASRFAFCPRGAGRDSHRLWEALYCGCIPIVRIDAVMIRLKQVVPMIALWDWSQITPEFLERLYPQACDWLATCVEPLTASYWTGQILRSSGQ